MQKELEKIWRGLQHIYSDWAGCGGCAGSKGRKSQNDILVRKYSKKINDFLWFIAFWPPSPCPPSKKVEKTKTSTKYKNELLLSRFWEWLFKFQIPAHFWNSCIWTSILECKLISNSFKILLTVSKYISWFNDLFPLPCAYASHVDVKFRFFSNSILIYVI